MKNNTSTADNKTIKTRVFIYNFKMVNKTKYSNKNKLLSKYAV